MIQHVQIVCLATQPWHIILRHIYRGSIAENIAFGVPPEKLILPVQQAASQAQMSVSLTPVRMGMTPLLANVEYVLVEAST